MKYSYYKFKTVIHGLETLYYRIKNDKFIEIYHPKLERWERSLVFRDIKDFKKHRGMKRITKKQLFLELL